MRDSVQGRYEDIRVKVRAATGSSECLLGQTQQFPALKNAKLWRCDQLFHDNLCLGRSFSVIAIPSRSLQCSTLRPSATQTATRFERSLVHAYREEELGSSDITWIQWLVEGEAEAHELRKLSSGKSKTGNSNLPANVPRTKNGAKVFASTNSSQTPWMGKKDNWPTSCIACKEKHPLWRCPVFREKTPTQRANLIADNQLCFSCLNGQHYVRKGPKPRKCLKQGCWSTHNTLAPWFRKKFSWKGLENSDRTEETTASSVTVVTNKAEESHGMPSVTKDKGLLQITEVNLKSSFHTEKVFVLGDSACSNSWNSETLIENWICKTHLWKLQFAGLTHIKPLTGKLSSWSWHRFIRLALARFLFQTVR